MYLVGGDPSWWIGAMAVEIESRFCMVTETLGDFS